jgi:hypothetical protein
MAKKISLEQGDERKRSPNQPVISVVGKGVSTYIWVGNNAPGDKACFGTISGMKVLERFAFDLLRALGHTPRWRPPTDKKKKTKR